MHGGQDPRSRSNHGPSPDVGALLRIRSVVLAYRRCRYPAGTHTTPGIEPKPMPTNFRVSVGVAADGDGLLMVMVGGQKRTAGPDGADLLPCRGQKRSAHDLSLLQHLPSTPQLLDILNSE